ncbi:hypothetical protein YYE_04573 [Plasmodium vinckei vinckei]|uniref:CIR protein PIR protein n=1 Tax=Plasmodium vinckei vinckei TaxID=54757 RepID=A0A081IAN4_PLAVN|nr:hypothetical protein YYE_04573 [Plasmodium vinckei vinckei]
MDAQLDFPDTLNGGNYQFNDNEICQTYCNNNCENDNCENDNDKIMAGWISLIKTIYDLDSIEDDIPNNMNINKYITIWLIYMLNLKPDNSISNLNDFYDQYKNQRGGHTLVSTNTKDYSNIIDDLINNTKYLMNVNKGIISKFYNLLKSLCSMYDDINKDISDCTQYYGKAKIFFDEYQELLNNNDFDTDDSSHTTLLPSLSNNYDNFKIYCAEKCTGCTSIPPLLTTKTTQVSVETSTPSHVQNNPHLSLQGSEVTSSSSSIASKLIPALLIFAIPIFLGIAYKYSLFGFDKQLQRQYLREKIKKITKKMNNYI